MFRDAGRAVKLIAAALKTAEFDVAYLEATAPHGRDDADRARGHADAGPRVAVSHRARDLQPAGLGPRAEPDWSLSSLIVEISQELCGRPITYTDETLARILSARHFVDVRRTLGGQPPT